MEYIKSKVITKNASEDSVMIMWIKKQLVKRNVRKIIEEEKNNSQMTNGAML